MEPGGGYLEQLTNGLSDQAGAAIGACAGIAALVIGARLAFSLVRRFAK